MVILILRVLFSAYRDRFFCLPSFTPPIDVVSQLRCRCYPFCPPLVCLIKIDASPPFLWRLFLQPPPSALFPARRSFTHSPLTFIIQFPQDVVFTKTRLLVRLSFQNSSPLFCSLEIHTTVGDLLCVVVGSTFRIHSLFYVTCLVRPPFSPSRST